MRITLQQTLRARVGSSAYACGIVVIAVNGEDGEGDVVVGVLIVHAATTRATASRHCDGKQSGGEHPYVSGKLMD